MQTKNFILAIVTILILALGGAAYLYMRNSATPTPAVDNTRPLSFQQTVQDLYDANPNVEQGYQASLRGDHEAAIVFYEAALEEATDPIQITHIKYRIARELENDDPAEAIRRFKEIVDDPMAPNNQKKYAAMWIPIIIMRGLDDDTAILAEALSGEPYSTFAADDLRTTANNFYEYSLTFGPTGIAEFSVAETLALKIKDGEITEEVMVNQAKERIVALMRDGVQYTEDAKTDPRNMYLIPRIYRAQARANAALAQIGDQQAIINFNTFFMDAINQGLAAKLDGAVRWDFFRSGYETFGTASFNNTQPHIDFLLRNLDTYTGMKNYLASEKDDRYGTRSIVIELANAYKPLKDKLIELGWTEADLSN